MGCLNFTQETSKKNSEINSLNIDQNKENISDETPKVEITYDYSFQLELFNELNKIYLGKNLIISPLGIFQILSLTTNGAKEETRAQMLEALKANSIEELNKINYEILSGVKCRKSLKISNKILSKFTPLKNFCDIAEKYSCSINSYQDLKKISNNISSEIHGKIPINLEPLSPLEVMILVNTIYFNNAWIFEFDEKLTKKLPFYNHGKKEIKVETMSQQNIFNYYEDEKIQMIELKFVADDMTSIVILPNDKIDINTYINDISNSKKEFSSLFSKLTPKNVYLELPKFEQQFSENLNQILINMGMKKAFDMADFSGITESKNIYIERVEHFTYLKIDEKIVEGAAETMIRMSEGVAFIERPILDNKMCIMKINRPFLFLIRCSALRKCQDMIFMSKIEEFMPK
jgi:serpin B